MGGSRIQLPLLLRAGNLDRSVLQAAECAAHEHEATRCDAISERHFCDVDCRHLRQLCGEALESSEAAPLVYRRGRGRTDGLRLL